MNIVEKVSSLLNNNCSYNIDVINNVLSKYGLSFPLSYDDIFKFDSDDIKSILNVFDGEKYNEVFDALMGNMTVINMYNSNPDNDFFKKRYDDAVIYINNLVINLNAFYSRIINSNIDLIDKYKLVICSDGIKESIVNFDEFDDLLHSLNLSVMEIGDIKKEVGKSNIRFACKGRDVSLLDSDLIKKVEDILLKENDLLNSVSAEELSRYLDDGIDGEGKSLDVVSVLTLLYGELENIKNSAGNKSVYNSGVKLLREYLDVYNGLRNIK